MADELSSGLVEKTGISYPQDYVLKTLNFVLASGKKLELKNLLVEFSYFEDIYTFVTSGSITIIDSQGFIELMRLTGNEYVEVEFGKTANGSNNIKKTFRVYKSSDRLPQGNLNSETYTLYFCSEELLLSEQNKISKSYKGKKVSEIIKDILQNFLKIKNKKIQVVEDTMGVYDFIVPRMKPLEAISWLSTYARPKNSIGADMLFFETKDGYNFRSLQSMFKDNIYNTYKYQAKNIGQDTMSMKEQLSTVLTYELNKPYDVLNEIGSGTLTNRLISIDPVSRTFKTTDFNYDKYKAQAKSLNSSAPINKTKNRLGVQETESYEGALKVLIGNSGQQEVSYIKEKEGAVAKDIFLETFIPNRTAQISLANYTSMKLSIPGDPGITAGRTINLNLSSLNPKANKDMDKFYSGKYLVTAVRHSIIVPNQYQTILEIAKDSSTTAEPDVNVSDVTIKGVIEE